MHMYIYIYMYYFVEREVLPTRSGELAFAHETPKQRCSSIALILLIAYTHIHTYLQVINIRLNIEFYLLWVVLLT